MHARCGSRLFPAPRYPLADTVRLNPTGFRGDVLIACMPRSTRGSCGRARCGWLKSTAMSMRLRTRRLPRNSISPSPRRCGSGSAAGPAIAALVRFIDAHREVFDVIFERDKFRWTDGVLLSALVSAARLIRLAVAVRGLLCSLPQPAHRGLPRTWAAFHRRQHVPRQASEAIPRLASCPSREPCCGL